MAKTVAAKPQLVQISTAYGTQKEGSPVLPRNKYTAIRDDKPKSNDEAKRPEFKVCKFTTDAIITEGSEIGTVQKVCANPACPVHHPKKANGAGGSDAQWKAEQEKQRREEAIANATGIRVLAAIRAAVPVRLTKRDLLFVTERLAALLDENRLAIAARPQGIKKAKDSDSIPKLFAAFLRRSEEGVLGSMLVELAILLATNRSNAAQVLRDAAAVYKVDTDAIAAKVRQEFAAKEKAKTTKTAAKKAAPQTASQGTVQTRQEERGGITVNPTGTLCGACNQAPHFLCSPARPSLPFVLLLSETGASSLAHPNGQSRRKKRGSVSMVVDSLPPCPCERRANRIPTLDSGIAKPLLQGRQGSGVP